jgi:alkylhydroperoxidase family enzyme
MISGSAWRKGAVRTRLVGEGRWAPGAGQSDMCSTDHNQAASGRSASKLFIGQAEAPDVSIALSSYPVRSPLFNLIMYGRDGLAGSERELGAVAASVANRCVYCAAVRASRFNNLTKRMDVIEAVFADGLEATLEEQLQAIFDFQAHLFDHATRGHRGRRSGAGRLRAQRAGMSRPGLVRCYLRLGEPLDAYARRADEASNTTDGQG